MGTDANSLLEIFRAVHMTQVVIALLLGAAAWLLTFGLDWVASAAREVLPSQRLTIFRLHTLGRFLVYLGAAATVAGVLLSPKPELLVALLGSAAVAIGFALKDVAASFFAGVILLFDQPFQVGDRVSFRGYYGDIQAIGLRSVRLLTLGHDCITIPNSVFLTDAVASGNSGSLSMMVSVELYVAINADADMAVELLREVVVTSRFAWLKNGVSVTVTEVAGENLIPALKMTARCYVVDLQLEKEFYTDVVLRARRAFAQAGIPRFERVLS